jgi:hypothetical protein
VWYQSQADNISHSYFFFAAGFFAFAAGFFAAGFFAAAFLTGIFGPPLIKMYHTS